MDEGGETVMDALLVGNCGVDAAAAGASAKGAAVLGGAAGGAASLVLAGAPIVGAPVDEGGETVMGALSVGSCGVDAV